MVSFQRETLPGPQSALGPFLVAVIRLACPRLALLVLSKLPTGECGWFSM